MKQELLSQRYLKALYLVADLFKDERRNVSNLPYIVHLVAVARTIQACGGQEEIQIAGLLHDVIEDIDSKVYSEAQLQEDFGHNIYMLVKAVSHDGTRAGKEAYIERLKGGSAELSLISGADMLHNTKDILIANDLSPEETKELMGGARAISREWFFGERLSVITEKLGKEHPLVLELDVWIKKLHELHAKIR